MMNSVFILGASGVIGGPFLTAVRKAYPSLKITAYLRSSSHDQALSRLDVDVVHGTFQETDKITDLCSKHDAVVNAATSTNTDLTTAIIKGLKMQKSDTKALLHVSGAGNFLDGGVSGNMNPDSKVWNDKNVDDIKKIDGSVLNGACDKLVLEAGAGDDLNTYIVCPPGVHGIVQSEIKTATLGAFVHPISQNAIKLGYSPYIGNGTSVFRVVHIDDVISLLMLVFEKVLRPSPHENSYSNYYVVEGVEHTWKELAQCFAEVLYRNGKITAAEAKQVPFDEAGFLAPLIGANMLVQNDNAKTLGYEIKGPTLFETLKSLSFDDVDLGRQSGH